MKQVFPNVRPRRLGTRGHSRYCYSGLRKKGELSPPILADLFCDNGATIHPNNVQSQNSQRTGTGTPDLMNERACILVREWAGKLLGINFSGMGDLANYLVDKLYVDQQSKAATQWSKLRTSQRQSEDEGAISSEIKGESGCEQDHMRELKRKLQVRPYRILLLLQMWAVIDRLVIYRSSIIYRRGGNQCRTATAKRRGCPVLQLLRHRRHRHRFRLPTRRSRKHPAATTTTTKKAALAVKGNREARRIRGMPSLQ